MTSPEFVVEAKRYYPMDEPMIIAPKLSRREEFAMSAALQNAHDALQHGNPPVGAVLIDYKHGGTYESQTDDMTDAHLFGHAEMRAYDKAQPVIGDDLSRCTLVTTAEPCSSCTPHLAEGKIGKIIYAAPRDAIFELTGIMRPRRINMDDLLIDGNTNTIVIGNHMALEALALFAEYGRRRGHVIEPDASETIKSLAAGKITGDLYDVQYDIDEYIEPELLLDAD